MPGARRVRVETSSDTTVVTATLCGTGVDAWGTPREEHRLCPQLLDELDAALDAAEASPTTRAVILAAEGRFWSNGLDLKWMDAHPTQADALQHRAEAVLARLLVFPMLTVGALTGHTVAAGAMLALALDRRVMNADKGFFFAPGSHIGLVYTEGMTQLMMSKVPTTMHNPLIVQSSRYTGRDLLALGVVEAAVPLPDVVASAFSDACGTTSHKAYPGQRDAVGAIKRRLYAAPHRMLCQGGANMGFASRPGAKL